MVMWILSGLILLNESQFYSKEQLFGLLGSILLCCIGIKVLTMKTKLLRFEAAMRTRTDSISSSKGLTD